MINNASEKNELINTILHDNVAMEHNSQPKTNSERSKKFRANESENKKVIRNHKTMLRNRRMRNIKKYAITTNDSIESIKKRLQSNELLFDTNFNVYKKGERPPTSPEYVGEIQVTKEEHDLIMKLRNHGSNSAEEECQSFKKENTTQEVSESASNLKPTSVDNDNTTQYVSDTASKSSKRKIQGSNATKVNYDTQMHNLHPTSDSDAHHFENENSDENSDKVNNDTIVSIPEIIADQNSTKNLTVYVKCGKKKAGKLGTIQISKFVKLTKAKYVVLTKEDETFFSTIEKGTTVMMREHAILEECTSYLCDVHEIVANSNTDIKLQLSWNASEAGVTRTRFYEPLENVQFLDDLGRSGDTKQKSLRKSKKPKRLSDETSEHFNYAKQLKDLDKTILSSGKAAKKLRDICDELMQAYTRDGEDAQPEIGRAAELLKHDSVITCLTRFSVIDPKLAKYATAEDKISQKYYTNLKEVASKSLDVTYMLLRSLMPLFHVPTILETKAFNKEELENEYADKVYTLYNSVTKKQSDLRYRIGQDPIEKDSYCGNAQGMKLREKVARIPKCEFQLGFLCEPHTCNYCFTMLEPKQIEKKPTSGMGDGLFARQNLKEGEYIVRYTGNITSEKPDSFSDYVVSVNVESKKGKKIKYIDGSNSHSLGKFANHSCVYNATFVELFAKNNDVPQLWIRADKNITMFDEITVHYGNEFFNYIDEKYGCGCEKCYNPSAQV